MTLTCRCLDSLLEIISGGRCVSYTVVSHGRVLGTTEFEYVRWKKGLRGGSFSPADDAADLMEIATGVSPTVFALGKKLREMDRERDEAAPAFATGRPRRARTTEDADFDAACDRQERLDLELRGPDGSLIETEYISLRDTEFLLSVVDDDPELDYDEWSEDEWEFSDEEMDEFDDDMFDEIESWAGEEDFEWNDEPEKPFPRYQILVSLIRDGDVP